MTTHKTNLKKAIRLKLNTPEEEAARIKIPVTTLAKARSTGHPAIPFIKIGKTVRYDPEAVDAWLKKNTFNKIETGA
ncbi:MAG: hypothetical protein CL866_02885 [Cycloclasticus sp.]|nr:hypothetical protein [Cycloclasticus sp.]MBG95801.1 hypothetical protein [Cycloclasticus sp.]HAI96060.1 DNA-binding protein [Methylococcaceae bacterium]|tara:strand:+ start:2903 stop:3133 length:231 start_codon:yes stop_codon:yes gene_type:complete